MAAESTNGIWGTPLFRILKWSPVMLIIVVMSWGYYVMVVSICLFIMEDLWGKICSLVVYHILFLFFFWSYFVTIITKCNPIPDKFKIPEDLKHKIKSAQNDTEIPEILEYIVKTQELPVEMRTPKNHYRFCDKCWIIKPDRCHHCSICGQCYLKRDHHCPWVNNCITFDNYKFFALFVMYAFLYCFLVTCFAFPYFIRIWKEEDILSTFQKYNVISGFIVVATWLVFVTPLFVSHLILLPINKTTSEYYHPPIFTYGVDKKAFHLGIWNNIVEILGNDKRKWAFPVGSSIGDGVSFPLRQSRRESGKKKEYIAIDTVDPSSTTQDNDVGELKVEQV